MLSRISLWWLALLSLIAARLWAMASLPLMDPSEPRYAEIARTMAAGADWVTPWFAPGIPFWGKPPLSFWAQAASMQVMGVNAFSARLPSLLATMVTLWLLYLFARRVACVNTARLATLIYLASPVVFIDAGAVLTDPFLTLGVTLSLVSFAMAQYDATRVWGYGFFVGIALGLLAKGPLALVLTGFPVIVAMWVSPDRRACWKALPWWRGSVLLVVLALPWYVMAEVKTPGFLRYFLIGEHLMRFIDPGWQGDLYGNGHRRPHGMIWLYLLVGSLPWILLPLRRLFPRDKALEINPASREAAPAAVLHASRAFSVRTLVSYLLAWVGAALLLFTPAGNILPTYVQPSMPALSLLLAIAWLHTVRLSRVSLGATGRLYGVGILLALAAAGAVVWAGGHEDQLKSERAMIAMVPPDAMAEGALIFMDKRPYSARFYSQGQARLMDATTLARQLSQTTDTLYIAIPRQRAHILLQGMSTSRQLVYRNPRYTLLVVAGDAALRRTLISRLTDTGNRTPHE